MKKTITRADYSGFCFGVKRALEKTYEAIIYKKGNEKIYTKGPLIHNKAVTDELEQKGVRIIDSLDEICGNATVIVRSHGEPESFYKEAEAKGVRLIDATCPFVEKIHTLVKKAHDDGYTIVIAGDRNHPEVTGTNGWCGNSAVVAETAQEVAEITSDKVFVVAQTTVTEEIFDEVCRNIKAAECVTRNTICSATKNRQDSCIELAKKSDIMVIIGSKNSSNTQKLYNVSKKHCIKTYFVENIEDLPLKQIEKCNKIGITAGASTPERIIEEVISIMCEITKETNLMNDYMDEIEKSLRLPRGGEIVNGKVHQVTENEVIVNLGCKKDGIIPKEEVSLEEGQKLSDVFSEGDEVQAKVIKTDDGDGGILLSKKKLEVNEHWNEIINAFENKELVTVKITRAVNGGVIGAYKEVTGFIPLSQLSDKYVEDPAEFIGQEMEVKITRVDQRRGKIVFSRRAVLNEEKEKKLAEIWANIHVDDIVEGKVMRFTDYGAFVDIGGIDGLLHISEISWGKLRHPQEVLQIGDTVKVKVLSMNEEKGKISLGLKQTMPEPWSVIDEKYEVGQVVTGKVVQIKEYGAFVELEPGLDGLVHISEIAHKRVNDINEELTIGQEVSAKILDIDKDKKRISLSIKATTAPEAEADDAEETEE